MLGQWFWMSGNVCGVEVEKQLMVDHIDDEWSSFYSRPRFSDITDDSFKNIFFNLLAPGRCGCIFKCNADNVMMTSDFNRIFLS